MEQNFLSRQITTQLKEKNVTLTQLSNELRISEEKIILGLQSGGLEIRTIESIAKFLRVPLYSLFFSPEVNVQIPLKPYHLWNDADEVLSPQRLTEEISNIENYLNYLKEQRRKWEQ